ncbi:FecR family protein [Sphingobacterium sp. lm-10]|uniref:FecR family protein n=1 Tax=Sphingobacterium sp. lm-10 TaxID=2944904 RepID=UPI0020217287|nr:FecR family protein [Sphingobacterium sp. lm-10]MCL7987026.1 FecR family protein [Sphingobacterium sp. lm-10]
MSKQSTSLEQLIQRYLEGKCTAEEKAKLHRWMESLEISDQSVSEEDIQQLRNRIDTIIQPEELNVKKLGRPRLHIVAIAASILCIGFASFFYLRNHQNKTKQVQSSIAECNSSSSDLDRLRVYHNHGTADRSIRLADGTEVTLTPNSSIYLLAGFETDHRHISLRGKARFDVAKDVSRPFSVITGGIHTTAIGTIFWVTHLDKQTLPVVQLLSGKVAITKKAINGTSKLLAALSPGDIWDNNGIRLPAKSPANRHETPLKPAVEKVEAIVLAFHHTPLKEVFDVLSTHFETDFSYENEDLTGMTFYGNYSAQVTIDDILKHIMLTHDLVITYHEETERYEVSLQLNHQTND